MDEDFCKSNNSAFRAISIFCQSQSVMVKVFRSFSTRSHSSACSGPIAIRLSGAKASMDVDHSLGLQLLADIRRIFAATRRNTISSAELVDRLKVDAANHWDEQFTQSKLARLL